MAADSTNILREYLVALGFKVDAASEKKADASLTKMDVRVTKLAKGLLGVAVAAKVMATAFAYEMEKLYYAGRKADTTVGNLKALDYGFRQVGGSGGVMQKALQGMAMAIRQNPGLVGVLTQLGVKHQGRDQADVMRDLVEQLNKMPFFVGSQFAEMFGIDPDTLLTLQTYQKEMDAAIAKRKQWAKDLGVDEEKAAAAGRQYASSLREIWERVGLLSDALSIQLLPAMQSFANFTIDILNNMTKLVTTFKSWEDFAERFWEGITGKQKGGGVQLSEDSQIRLGRAGDPYEAPSWWQRMKDSWGSMRGGSKPAAASPAPVAAATPGVDSSTLSTLEKKQAYLAALEAKYGLPAGILDRVWNKESKRGDPRFMKSSAGAEGHFQFMPAAQKDYGLDDPYDFEKSANAAARYYKNMHRKYGGDSALAAAAYNWGPGNVDKYRLGKATMPAETTDYVKSVAGVEITNHISVQGVSDPKAAADFVTDGQARVNADLVRNLSPRVQ